MKEEIIAVSGNGEAIEQKDDLINLAEKRLHNLTKILNLSLRVTNHYDWVDQNGKPYLTSSGAEKIARLFGISWKIEKIEKVKTEDEKGEFYYYQATGVFSLGKDSIVAVGTCSSKDAFFAKVKDEWKPLSEIDETNIMKSSYSNCIVNGITRILGLRNLTWEQVKEGGIDVNQVAKIEYKKKGGQKISQAQAKRMFAIAKRKNMPPEVLKNTLKTAYGYEHSTDIEKDKYDDIIKWIENWQPPKPEEEFKIEEDKDVSKTNPEVSG